MDRTAELTELLMGSEWLQHLLDIVAALDLPDCWIGAGAVRDLVWDTRYGDGFDADRIKDVDVAYFDPHDLSAAREHDLERILRDQEPAVDWDVKNQARVHLWYEARFGQPAAPLTSTTEAIATWPETATAVGVRRDGARGLEVTAPHGLDDLLDGVWRKNAVRVTDTEYQARLERKQPQRRWPGVVVIEPVG